MDGPFRRRIRRRLYYGDKAALDTPSLPMSELSVEYFRDAVSQKLGNVGLDTASDLIKRNRVSPCSMVLSMIYAKRLKQRNKEYLDSMSSSDVFFISMMMASKYLYDEGVDEEVFNDEWADNTDQDIDDVNDMEMDFLKAIDWHLFVRPEEFDDAVSAIEKRLALQEGLKRGWFTYSELDVLADGKLMAGLWTQVAIECSKLTTVLSAAYMTSLLSMLGSTALAFQLAGPLSTATVAICSLSVSPMLTPLSKPALQASVSPLFNEPRSSQGHIWKENISGVLREEWKGSEDSFVEAWHHLDYGEPVSLEGCPESIESGESGEEENTDIEVMKMDGGDSKKDERGATSTSSLWSLLFFDSLLTQLWAVSSPKKASSDSNGSDQSSSPRLLHCHRWRTQRRRHRVPLAAPYSLDSDTDKQNLSSTPEDVMDSVDLRHSVDRDSVDGTMHKSYKPNPKPFSSSSLTNGEKQDTSSRCSTVVPGNENPLLSLMEWYNAVLGSNPYHKYYNKHPLDSDPQRRCSGMSTEPSTASMHHQEFRHPASNEHVYTTRTPEMALRNPHNVKAAMLSSPLLTMPTIQVATGFHTSIPHVAQAT